MKILVVNGSPRAEKSNTQVLVNAFLEGAAESGAESEIVYLNDKDIKHCCGDYHCWIKTPGVCMRKDDMAEILDKYRKADLVIFATPLYVYTVSGMMKDFMDRLLPLVQPYINTEDGLSSHPSRHDKEQSVLVISNCGFPEQDHFSGLKETFKRCFRSANSKSLAGIICCACGEMLKPGSFRAGVQWYLDAMKQAGREIMAQGFVSAETQLILDTPLVKDKEIFAQMANEYWKSILPQETSATVSSDTLPGELLSPSESKDTVRDLISVMPTIFNSKAAEGLEAVIQFVVTDENPGVYYLCIEDGKCAAYAGKHPKPKATITTPSDVWLAIANGKLNGAMAYMTGKYTATGDIVLLTRLATMFAQTK